jgi:hypothetical protein
VLTVEYANEQLKVDDGKLKFKGKEEANGKAEL